MTNRRIYRGQRRGRTEHLERLREGPMRRRRRVTFEDLDLEDLDVFEVELPETEKRPAGEGEPLEDLEA